MRPAEEGPARIARTQPQSDIDTSIFTSSQVKPLQPILDDDGRSGTLSVYIVNEFGRIAVPSDRHNRLFECDSYVILYRYSPSSGGARIEKRIAYFWQGRDSPITQKGTSALLTVDISKETGGELTQVRVAQGKEPVHFVEIMGGVVVIRCGKDPLTSKETHGGQDKGTFTTFDVRVSESGGILACECRSGDDVQLYPFGSVIAFPPKETPIIYHGAWVAEPSRKGVEAKSLFKSLGTLQTNGPRILTHTEEAHEVLKRAGWKASEWHRVVEKIPSSASPRVFSFAMGVGNVVVRGNRSPNCSSLDLTQLTVIFKGEEIFDVTQEDLSDLPVVVCDNGDEIYVRFCNAKPQEKTVALRTVLRSSSVWVVAAGHETPAFTCRFQGWRRDSKDSSELFKRTSAQCVLDDLSKKTFSLAEVLAFASTLQTGGAQALSERHHIDVSKLEDLLAEDDFPKLFKMPRDKFDAMPEWKRLRLKQDVGLY
ncbi:hypothetical protein M427DRAFT_35444 [Gonapodya prolifera JEL478]|uniref:HP domain-containing protein n=1 Tax=Gonapodya prolifera (strain JEL478) TaxID=1344416 RepID=A0A139A4H4_GONPJ|nr:hypothetical protein M427DRAFT_35444 [Gonapodya prolifera JEL478]|eukprot:KXS11690.1 hypothetical protein M427DRAFT_35444 [Gonapodya prolifera JEL478]